jgi:DNA-binding HxlR family transcriptional regulator
VLLIESLQTGAMRFGELQRHINGVSAKVLSANLRRLEDAGLISRRVYAEVPARVEYSLTEEGISAVAPLREVRLWAESHYAQALALKSATIEQRSETAA